MKTTKTQSEKARREPKVKPAGTKKSTVKNTDAEGSSPHVDLEKANFSERNHGRTALPLGPDHEPGTV